MSRVSVAERARLSVFLARGLARRLISRVTAHPVVSWPFSFGKADRLLIAPQDLRTADATRASEIYAGRFVFAGKVVICDSPLALRDRGRRRKTGRSRCSASAGCAICAPPNPASPAPMPARWSTNGSRCNGSRRPDRLACRGRGAPRHLLAQPGAAGARRFRRAVLPPLPAQPDPAGPASAPYRVGGARRRAAPAGSDRDRPMRRCAWPGQQRHIRSRHQAARSTSSARQILPDGGHISRNPGALIELLVDLLPLRTAFTARNIAPPPALLNAIDRMMPMLRFFRHGDGNFALFNGMGPTRPICSPPSSPTTMPAARRSPMRRIPATSASSARARLS